MKGKIILPMFMILLLVTSVMGIVPIGSVFDDQISYPSKSVETSHETYVGSVDSSSLSTPDYLVNGLLSPIGNNLFDRETFIEKDKFLANNIKNSNDFKKGNTYGAFVMYNGKTGSDELISIGKSCPDNSYVTIFNMVKSGTKWIQANYIFAHAYYKDRVNYYSNYDTGPESKVYYGYTCYTYDDPDSNICTPGSRVCTIGNNYDECSSDGKRWDGKSCSSGTECTQYGNNVIECTADCVKEWLPYQQNVCEGVSFKQTDIQCGTGTRNKVGTKTCSSGFDCVNGECVSQEPEKQCNLLGAYNCRDLAGMFSSAEYVLQQCKNINNVWQWIDVQSPCPGGCYAKGLTGVCLLGNQCRIDSDCTATQFCDKTSVINPLGILTTLGECKETNPEETCSQKEGSICSTNYECVGSVQTATDTDKCCIGHCQKILEKTCSQLSGDICKINEVCDGQIQVAGDTNDCCIGTCESQTNTPKLEIIGDPKFNFATQNIAGFTFGKLTTEVKLTNNGKSMGDYWLLELQPLPVFSLSKKGIDLGVRACDSKYPNNAHTKFKLSAGQTEIISVTSTIVEPYAFDYKIVLFTDCDVNGGIVVTNDMNGGENPFINSDNAWITWEKNIKLDFDNSPEVKCGDGWCQASEQKEQSCEYDCGKGFCGDGTCQKPEMVRITGCKDDCEFGYCDVGYIEKSCSADFQLKVDICTEPANDVNVNWERGVEYDCSGAEPNQYCLLTGCVPNAPDPTICCEVYHGIWSGSTFDCELRSVCEGEEILPGNIKYVFCPNDCGDVVPPETCILTSTPVEIQGLESATETKVTEFRKTHQCETDLDCCGYGNVTCVLSEKASDWWQKLWDIGNDQYGFCLSDENKNLIGTTDTYSFKVQKGINPNDISKFTATDLMKSSCTTTQQCEEIEGETINCRPMSWLISEGHVTETEAEDLLDKSAIAFGAGGAAVGIGACVAGASALTIATAGTAGIVAFPLCAIAGGVIGVGIDDILSTFGNKDTEQAGYCIMESEESFDIKSWVAELFGWDADDEKVTYAIIIAIVVLIGIIIMLSKPPKQKQPRIQSY